MFADRPPVCPSIAAVVASALMQQPSYCRSLHTLLQSCPFILLFVTYGLSCCTPIHSSGGAVAVVLIVVVVVVVVTWHGGNFIWHINEVTLRRSRLVLGWVTVFGG